MRTSFASLAGGLAALAGCAVGPDYQRPDVPVPQRYAQGPAGAATRPAVDIERWWTILGDPQLESVVARAVEHNPDLRIAEARIREARARRSGVASELWPQVGVGSSYAFKGSSRNTTKMEGGSSNGGLLGGTRLPSISIAPGAAGAAPTITVNPRSSSSGSSGGSSGSIATSAANSLISRVLGTGGESDSAVPKREQNLFQAGFDASWELDVFGGTRRAIEAADAEIAAAEEDRRDVLVTLVAETALNYVEARTYQRRISVALENIDAQRRTVELTKSRFQAGITNDLDLAQAQAQLALTSAEVPSLEILRDQAVHRLGVLLGQVPESLLEEMAAEKPLPQAPPEVPVGLPSELLRRRPDIRREERRLAAATARIGEATAELFPRFTIDGSLGTQTYDIQHFFDRNSAFWSVGPGVSWPLFDANRRRAEIQAQEAVRDAALAGYETSILRALEEAENAMVAYRKEQTRYGHLAMAVEANRRATQLATDRYRKQISDFLRVLESQRSLYVSQDSLIQSESQAVLNVISLYKALGGGWDLPEEAAVATQGRPGQPKT